MKLKPSWVLGALSVMGITSIVAFTGCGGDDSGATTGDDAGQGADTSMGDDGSSAPMCGNGVQDRGEECDLGAENGMGMGCDSNCTWTCTAGDGGDVSKCGSTVCITPATCTETHTCVLGTKTPVGGTCGTAMVCNATGMCITPRCGDSIVETGEECDNGAANGPGTGCESDCHFSCGGTDTAHNCDAPDSCTATGTCSTSTHTCTAGAPVTDGTTCTTSTITSGICKSGHCTSASCGDGVIEAPEQCDFGAGNGVGTGCETDCMFSCPTLAQTTGCTQPTDSCAGVNACASVTSGTEVGQKCVQGSPLTNGTTCGTGGMCTGGVCVTATCGNGTINAGEQCDFGSAHNGMGLGCSASCQFDCEKTPNDTCTTNVDPCTATPHACTTATTTFGTLTGQTCQATTPIASCGSCGTGNYCGSIPGHVCAPARCGDGCVDEASEQCEPPGTATCSATCQTIVVAVCGNGTREAPEQCDDGNTQNLDGCNSGCLFEQIHRADSITMEFTPPGPCGHNALGGAIASAAQSMVTAPLSASITSGGTNILFAFLGITDLSGTNQASGLSLGSVAGLMPTYTGSANGNADLDWWYVMDPNSVTMDAMGHYVPKSTLGATFAGGVLSASGSLDLALVLGGTMASQLHMSGAMLSASPALPNAPTESTNAMAPGHLPAEHLASTVTSFPTMTGGSLCGNVSAASLAAIPLTSSITTGICGTVGGYTSSNSLLDLIVGGCLGGIAIVATNPDQTDSAQPAFGAGYPYTLQVNSSTHKVVSCQDKNHTMSTTAAQLATCEAAAAYSSYFLFTSDRVIIHNQ
jgi:cysteine-rich repeat protein